MMQYAIMQNNRLSSLLSPADFHAVDSVLRNFGLWVKNVRHIQTCTEVSMMLMLIQAQKMNSSELQKVFPAQHWIFTLPTWQKERTSVTALETMEQRFDMLSIIFWLKNKPNNWWKWWNNTTPQASFLLRWQRFTLTKMWWDLENWSIHIPLNWPATWIICSRTEMLTGWKFFPI